MNELKLVVIGGGHLGRIHARLLRDVPHARLVAVIDPDVHVRQELSDQLDVPCLPEITSLLGTFDAAVVAAPTRFHKSIGVPLLERQIPTFIEKPLAPSTAECSALTEAARRNQTWLQVGHIERFNPVVENLPDVLLPPRLVRAVRQGPYTFRCTDVGVVMDLMIHDIDLVLHWIPAPVQRVTASGFSVLSDHEDIAQAELVFANGAVATLFASRVSPTRQRSLELFGTAGGAYLDLDQRSLRQIQAPTNRPAATPSAEARQHLTQHLFEEVLPVEQTSFAEANPLLAELCDFVASIREHRQPRVGGEPGARAVDIAERVLRKMHVLPWNATDLADREVREQRFRQAG